VAKGIIEMFEFGQKVGRQTKSNVGKGVTQNKAWSDLLQSFAAQTTPSQIQIGQGQETQSFHHSLPGSGLQKTKTTGSALPYRASSEKLPGEEAIQTPASSNDKLRKQASVQIAASNPEFTMQVNRNLSVVTTRLEARPDKETILLDGVYRLVEPNRRVADSGVAQIYVASAANIDANHKLFQTDEEPLTKAPDLGKTRKKSTQSKQVATALVSAEEATSSARTRPITVQLVQQVDIQPVKQPAVTQVSFAVEPGHLPVTGAFALAAGLPKSQAGKTSSAMQSDLVLNTSPKSVATLSSAQLPLEGKALRSMGERGQIAPTPVSTGEGNLVKRAPSTTALLDVGQSTTAVKPMSGAQHTGYLQQAIPLAVSTGRAIASVSTATLTQTNKAELLDADSGGISQSHQIPATVKSHKVMKATLDTEAASGKLVESPPAKDSRLVSEMRVEQETDSFSRLAFGETLQVTGNQPKLPSSKSPVDAQSYVDWPQAEIQLADGVLRLISRGQPDSLTLVLDSPLGEVGLSVHRTELGLHLLLSTSNDQARGLLEQGLGQLQNRLDQLGCGFVGAEVTADGKGHQAFGEQGRHRRPPIQFADEAHNLPSELGLQADSLLDTFA